MAAPCTGSSHEPGLMWWVTAPTRGQTARDQLEELCSFSWERWLAWAIDELSLRASRRSRSTASSVNMAQGTWCAEEGRRLTSLCENRNCGRPSRSVGAADKVCVLIQCISNSASLQACSSLLITVEDASVYKLQQGWSVLNIRCSMEPALSKGGVFGWPMPQVSWTERRGWHSCKSLWSLCLVLSFFLFLQMHQQT